MVIVFVKSTRLKLPWRTAGDAPRSHAHRNQDLDRIGDLGLVAVDVESMEATGVEPDSTGTPGFCQPSQRLRS
jgi:hypothetical protein